MNNEIVKEIVQMVYNIKTLDFDFSNNDYYEKLKELSYFVWEEYHSELLKCLDELDIESNIDYQLFWYECLAFPPETPKTFYKNGAPSFVFYGMVPSKIEESLLDIGGFHDVNINHVIYENSIFSLYLDSRRWGVKSDSDYEGKLSFKGEVNILYSCGNVENIYYEETDFITKNLAGNNILSACELPMIQYIFTNIGMDNKYLLPNKRLFWISVSGVSCDTYYDIYIIFDSWEYEK